MHPKRTLRRILHQVWRIFPKSKWRQSIAKDVD